MSKKPNLLQITPEQELKFHGPFEKVVMTNMRLSNLVDKVVLFKIKTTAPKKYCVRPNSGTIMPLESVKVVIGLQPFDYDPNEKNKHKFMVQSLATNYTEDVSVDYDREFMEADPESISETKLRCVFLLPDAPPAAKPEAPVTKKVEPSGLASSSAKLIGEEKGNAGSGTDYDKNVTRVMAEVASQLSWDNNREKSASEEAEFLRQENLLLNEQLLQLQRSLEGKDSTSATSSFHRQPNNPYSPPPMPSSQQMQQMKMFYIVASVLLAFMGVLIGKFVL